METSFRRVVPGLILPVTSAGPGGNDRHRVSRLESLLSEAFALADNDRPEGRPGDRNGGEPGRRSSDHADEDSSLPAFAPMLDDIGHALILANRQAAEFSPAFSADLALIARRAYGAGSGGMPLFGNPLGGLFNQRG